MGFNSGFKGLIPFCLLSHPCTLLFFSMFLPHFALFPRHPSSILFCFSLSLSFSLSFTYLSRRHKGASRNQTLQDGTTWFSVCANQRITFRNYKLHISCRNRFYKPSNYRIRDLNVIVVHWRGRPPDLVSSSMDVLPDLKRWYHWWYCVRLKQSSPQACCNIWKASVKVCFPNLK